MSTKYIHLPRVSIHFRPHNRSNCVFGENMFTVIIWLLLHITGIVSVVFKEKKQKSLGIGRNKKKHMFFLPEVIKTSKEFNYTRLR